MLNSRRVCIFIDGENLRHSILELFPTTFKKWDYLPKKADWTKFFDWVAEQAGGSNVERVRTYWYVVKDIDFSPYNLNIVRKKEDKLALRKILSRDKKIKQDLDAIASNQIKLDTLTDQIVDDLLNIQDKMQGRFDGWENIHNTIERMGKSIEFRRAGAIRYNLFDQSLGTEKAVDVKLATDLLKLKDIYDTAIIISGDQDYVPAVEALKDLGKSIVNVSFLTDQGYLLPGGAKRLNQTTDWSIAVKHPDLKTYLCL